MWKAIVKTFCLRIKYSWALLNSHKIQYTPISCSSQVSKARNNLRFPGGIIFNTSSRLRLSGESSEHEFLSSYRGVPRFTQRQFGEVYWQKLNWMETRGLLPAVSNSEKLMWHKDKQQRAMENLLSQVNLKVLFSHFDKTTVSLIPGA